MSKSEQVRCPECGSDLPPGLPLGLCPHCALAEFHVGGRPVPARAEDGAAAAGPGDFGDYEGLREVGRGGMGVVFKAWQKSLERHVAIKMPIFGGFITPDLIKRFRGEAVFAASLHHRNIVPIHEVGIRNGQHYLTMDYVDGQNLAARLRARPMSILETVVCLLKVARAVDYAHGQNVLHIDLKPSNILVDAEGEPYVTDFGLAQRIDGNSTITLSGQVVGSPNFMAPEQASPGRGAVDRRSDVYGLGATLYYCLCGRPPFQAANLETTLNLVLTVEPVSPRVLNPSVPLDLETICLKCLEKEPARRYQTAKDLADEFERFVHHTPIQARPISRWAKVGRWGRRNPALAAAISAAALFLIVGFLVAVWLAGRATREASTARLNLYLADMSLAQQAIQRNNFAAARERLLAHLPEPGWPDLRGWEWRYLWKAVEAQHSESWGADKSVRSVAVSPSGAIAADVGRRHGGTVVLDLLRHQIVTNFSAGFGPQSKKSGVFSPDGAVLAMARSNGVLLAHSGRWDTEVLESKRNGTVFSLAFYPDGGTLLATSSSGLKAWKVPSGQEIDPPVNFARECRNLEISPDGRWLALSTISDLLVWSLPTGEQVLSRKMGLDQVPAIALSRRGWLAACDRDGRVFVWDLNVVSASAGTTNLLVQLDTHARGPNYAAAFSPDAGVLAVAGSDQLIRTYDTIDWRQRNAFRGHDAEIWSLAFAPNSAQLVSGGKDGLRVWNPQMLPESGVLPGTWFPLRFTPDSKLAVTLTAGRVLQFWRTDTLALESTFKPPAHLPPHFVEITPDSRTVVYKSVSNVIHILDRERGESRGALKLDPAGLEDAIPSKCSPDSRRVAVETKRRRDGRTVRAAELFDLNTGERVAVVDGFKPLLFSPDGRYLGGKVAETNAAIWDLQRQQRREFLGGSEKVNQVALSRNGLIAASCDDHVIRVWEISSGRLCSLLRGHRAGVGQILFSHDDRTLFSTSTDRTLKAWNVARGQEVLSLDHEKDTWELALSPDDTTLAVGGVTGQPQPITLVRAPSLADIDAALRRAQR